eukprot:4423351-Prymnesium_polylepis.1
MAAVDADRDAACACQPLEHAVLEQLALRAIGAVQHEHGPHCVTAGRQARVGVRVCASAAVAVCVRSAALTWCRSVPLLAHQQQGTALANFRLDRDVLDAEPGGVGVGVVLLWRELLHEIAGG